MDEMEQIVEATGIEPHADQMVTDWLFMVIWQLIERIELLEGKQSIH